MDINNYDKYSYTLNDEEYDEEEVVESDEYYDDDGEYYDDENYDDEYHEEDEYHDDYGDEYADEDYHYPEPAQQDDTLNKILEEIAALKRSVALTHVVPVAAPVAGGLPYAIVSPFGAMGNTTTIVQQQNNDMLVFNELGRLRDEISKTQSNQQMFVEVARLKDSMRMDAKINEGRLQDEIHRLNRQLQDMLNRNNNQR